MNAKPNVSDDRHRSNLVLLGELRADGFKIEANSQGYRVECNGVFIGAAGTRNKPHGRYAEANRRDYLEIALRLALDYSARAKEVA